MGQKGDVTYEIRADDSKLDSDLSAADKKVQKSTEKTADKSEQVEKQTGKVKKQVKEDVTEHHKQQNAQQEQSDEDSGQKREGIAKKCGENLKGIAGGTAKAVGAGFLTVGAAAVGVGVAAISSANDMQKAMNGFIAATGKGKEVTERYQTVLENVYKNNYGESFEDIAKSMALVTAQMGELSDAELQSITESAYLLQDVFEIDLQESLRGADAMMKQFGVSSEEAYNLMAQGAQKGLNQNGDLADQIAEYSVYYADMGLSATDMMNAIAKGAESGAFQIDYLNDAVKEFGIRTKDNSDSTKEAYKALGLNADELTKKFAEGGEGAKSAFKEVTNALSNVNDKVKQNEIGVALFGTKFEDLGVDAVLQLTAIEGEISNTKDALGEMAEVKYDDLGSMFEGLKRSVELLLIPLGEQLIPLLSELFEGVLPMIEEYLPPIMDVISEFASVLLDLAQNVMPANSGILDVFIGLLKQLSETVLPQLLNLFVEIAPLIGDLVSSILPVLAKVIEAILPPLVEIISKALPPLIELITALMPILECIIDVLSPIIDLFVELLVPIIDLIEGAITPLIEILTPLINVVLVALGNQLQLLMGVFKAVFNEISEVVITAVSTLKEVFQNLIDFIVNVFTGNWQGAWENVKNIFGAIVEGLGNLFKIPINFIIDCINNFLSGLNRLKIPDWVPVVGGSSFSIDLIPRLKQGKDFVPKDMMPAYLDYGERVLTQTQNVKFNAMGGLEGMEKALSIDGSLKSTPQIILGKGCIVVESMIDGKVAGKTLAPYIDTELGSEAKFMERT